MSSPDEAWLETPSILRARFRGMEWTLVYQYPGHSVVYRLSRSGKAQSFLKIRPRDTYPTVEAEAARLAWASEHVPVPAVLEVDRDEATQWLVTSPLPGVDATEVESVGREALTRILARGLRELHDTAPVQSCPFDFRLPAAIAHVRQRRDRGQIDPGRDFHPEFSHLDVDAAITLLVESAPTTQDLVVCHGDYCLPNVIIHGGAVTGYVDLGELGVADRWWDLAVATWSLEWNLGGGLEGLFLSEYGVAPDRDRIDFFRLLYDLVG